MWLKFGSSAFKAPSLPGWGRTRAAIGLGLRLWIAGVVIFALGHMVSVWAARRDVPEATLRRLEPLLNAARDTGRANFASIAAAEAKGHGLTVPQCLGYLRDNLHYDLGFRERAALALFHDRAAALSLAPKGIDLDRALALPGAPMSQ